MQTTRRNFVKTAAAVSAFAPAMSWSQPLNKLTLQAAWVNDAEFMGYFIALDNGYYKAEGLDVTYLCAAARIAAPRAFLGVMIAEWLATGTGVGNESSQR